MFKRFVFLMALNTLNVTQVWSTEQDINPSLDKINQTIHQKLAKDESFIFCPLGVIQTLTALHGIVEKSLQDEIENLVSGSNIVGKVAYLNQLLRNFSSATTAKEDQHFALINNNYAILADYLDVKLETDKKFKALGINPLIVNFKKAYETAQLINNIVKNDTQSKIIELLSPNSFSSDDVFVLLHTFYVKDKWKMYNVDECRLDFQDQNNLLKKVYGFKVEGQEFQCHQDDNITYLALPTRQDYQVIIRHSQGNIQPVSLLEINALLTSPKLYTRSI